MNQEIFDFDKFLSRNCIFYFDFILFSTGARKEYKEKHA